MVALAIGLAVVVGVSLGLLGGGGSILTVPLLTYVAGLDPKHAIATSLLVVGVTSSVGAVSHARAGRVQWRTAALFGLTSMVGAYSGGQLTRFIPGRALLIVFAVIMVATAIAMLRGRKSSSAECVPRGVAALAKTAAVGLALGLVTGTVGAGGGFLVVPALVLMAGLPMAAAVGTSLAVIAMNSFAGLAGYLSVVGIDWALAGTVTGAAVVGALIGSRFAARVDPEVLRRAFGWFVLIMASVVLGEEVNPIAGYLGAGLTVLVALMTLACSHIPACPLRGLTTRPPAAAAAV